MVAATSTRVRATYWRDGRLCWLDTHRPVDERLGTHVVLWCVVDPVAYAAHLVADAEADRRWRDGLLEAAERVRAVGPERRWHAFYSDGGQADACVASLARAHPNPGVNYEVVPVTGWSWCAYCHQPVIEADGAWRHHQGGFPADCSPANLVDPAADDGVPRMATPAGRVHTPPAGVGW